MFVLVHGVFGLFDQSVAICDFLFFSGCFGGVVGVSCQSDHGWFDLVHVISICGGSNGLDLEEFESFGVLGFPSLEARLLFVVVFYSGDVCRYSYSCFDEEMV